MYNVVHIITLFVLDCIFHRAVFDLYKRYYFGSETNIPQWQPTSPDLMV